MRYFAVTDTAGCILIPNATTFEEATENEFANTLWVLSEDGLRGFVARALDALGEGQTLKRRLCVDGLTHADPQSSWAGDGQFPPFAIFDIDMQENLQPYYATRAQAEMAMARILKED